MVLPRETLERPELELCCEAKMEKWYDNAKFTSVH
jgi:hypothetical protein